MRMRVGIWVALLVLLCSVLVAGAVVLAEDGRDSLGMKTPGLDDQLVPDTAEHAVEEIAAGKLLVSPAKVDLAEVGGSASYEVVLSQGPTAPVIVTIKPDDQTTVNLTMVVFDTDDWNTPKDITVTAVDDGIAEGIHDSAIKHSASSLDPNYTGLDPVYVTATIEDNDTAGIQVSPTALTVAEPDGTAAFTVTLVSEPQFELEVPLVPSNSECSVSPQQITLDSDNWRDGASATVSARDDDVFDGTRTCTIRVESPNTEDPIYRELDPDDVSVTVEDDERVQVFLPQMRRGWPPPPAAPVLQAIDNPDGDGAFTVEWTAAARAASYVLQQAPTTLFQNPSQVYDGPATSYDVQGLGASRRHFRVRARNASGDSAWSNVQQVDVLWHQEGSEGEDREEEERQNNGPVMPGFEYFGRLLEVNDLSDYFYFDLPAGGIVEVDLSNIPAGQNYDLAIRDRSLNTQEGWYSVRSGNRDEHVATTLPASRYYIQVHKRSGSGSSQAYHLRVQY